MPFKEQKIFKIVSFKCNTGHRKHFIQDTELDFHVEKFLFLTKFDVEANYLNLTLATRAKTCYNEGPNFLS